MAKADRNDDRCPPHSLGKLIEWKHSVRITIKGDDASTTPHSLGKLIEWKQYQFLCLHIHPSQITPHSLGKLIEWKLVPLTITIWITAFRLPTRWGN